MFTVVCVCEWTYLCLQASFVHEMELKDLEIMDLKQQLAGVTEELAAAACLPAEACLTHAPRGGDDAAMTEKMHMRHFSCRAAPPEHVPAFSNAEGNVHTPTEATQQVILTFIRAVVLSAALRGIPHDLQERWRNCLCIRTLWVESN